MQSLFMSIYGGVTVAKLAARNNDKEPKNPKKKANEVEIGDEIIVGGLQFEVVQIDELEKKYCFVDKYACDYYVEKDKSVEYLKK